MIFTYYQYCYSKTYKDNILLLGLLYLDTMIYCAYNIGYYKSVTFVAHSFECIKYPTYQIFQRKAGIYSADGGSKIILNQKKILIKHQSYLVL